MVSLIQDVLRRYRWGLKYETSLNQRAAVEQILLDAANNKRALPSGQECRDLAFRLGMPPEWAKPDGFIPEVSATFEVVSDGITGHSPVPVKRVERQDDGSLTVILDYWPRRVNHG